MTKKERKELDRARRFAAGLCYDCKSPAVPGKTNCQRHLDILKAKHALRVASRNLLGVCLKCGGAVSSGRLCERHNLMRRERRRAMKKTPAVKMMRSIKKRLKNSSRYADQIPFLELTGRSPKSMVAHLESLWKPGMSWDNYGYGKGKWQLDHIRPICSFDRTSREGLKAAFHFSNTQPLWHEENMEKAASIPGESSSGIAMCS